MNEDVIIKQCMRTGQPIPEAFANPPSLLFGNEFYFQAYLELDKARPIGFNSGYIPLSAILEYGVYRKLTNDEIDELVTIIRIVDNLLSLGQDK